MNMMICIRMSWMITDVPSSPQKSELCLQVGTLLKQGQIIHRRGDLFNIFLVFMMYKIRGRGRG